MDSQLTHSVNNALSQPHLTGRRSACILRQLTQISILQARCGGFMRLAWKLMLLTGMAACSIYGQVTSGSLSGTVLDANGAAVPGASITATHQPTNREYPTSSTSAGLYVLPNL